MNYHLMKATKNEDDKDMVISGFTRWLCGEVHRIDSIQNETYDNLACPSGITQDPPGALRALSLDDAS